MDKIYYKELIEKYFDGNITDAEIKELSDWIKNCLLYTSPSPRD